jgi:hypothetical protein
MTGRDDHRSDGNGGAGGSGSGGLERAIRQVRRRVQQAFEHRPRQIFVSVNGHLLASHSVTATNSDTELQIESHQPIEFIEISSEQGIRLALLDAESGMTDEAGRILQTIELSDGRFLEVALSLDNASPSLRILYHDPAAAESEFCPSIPLPGAPATNTNATPELAERAGEDARFLRNQ